MAQGLEVEEVDAPHFNKINGHLDYKFYSLTKRNIPGFPKIGNRIDIPLDQYSHCCQWIEETNNHSTRIFFFTQNKETAENIKNNLLKGKYTKDVLPLIQNNYGDDGGKVFINIAVCGDIVRSNNWQIDNVITEKNENNYNDGKGFVYHVTNVLADHPPSLTETILKDNNGEEWNEIKSSIANKYDYKYHPKIDLNVCFLNMTLYKDNLPTFSMYPLNKKKIKENDGCKRDHFKRIKFPFEDISKRIVTNVKGQLHEEFSKIFYLSSTFSADDPSNNVTQVYYICGFNTEEIKEYLEIVSQKKIWSKEEAFNTIKKEIKVEKCNNKINTPIIIDYIIAIPKDPNYLQMEKFTTPEMEENLG